MSVKICYYSANGIEMPGLSRVCKKLMDEKVPLELTIRSRHDLFDSKMIDEFARQVEVSDYTVLLLHGGKGSCPGFDKYIKGSKRLHIQPTGGEEDIALSAENSTDYGNDIFRNCLLYLKNGGVDNLYNLFIYLYRAITNEDRSVPAPAPVLNEGIYHPRAKEAHTELDRYLTWHKGIFKDTDNMPVIGLWFWQSHWINGNTGYIDSIIKEIESQRCIPICVFNRRVKDIDLKNKDAAEIVDTFFRKEKRTVIDVLLNPASFSLSMLGKDYDRILPALDVPVLQIICTTNPRKEWEETMQAVNPMDVSISVAMPEFDGNLITVVVAAREIKGIDQYTGAVFVRTEAIPERVKKAVRLAKNWALLRHIRNDRKKVAIIFHHNPPRNDRLGCAFGLDSFASVKNIVDRMAEEGYKVEKKYNNGDELAKEMLSGLTNDTRWLSVEDLHKRAACAVPAKVYNKWREGLPAGIIKKQTKDWGEYPGEIFVHNKEYIINGIINGNVYIGLQPPRGHLENSEENLHNPDLAPPHHYLAYYRWIKYGFKADAVIHVGKHGSLEWLPGKSVGLSGNCYPDLAIQDLPNIYPYIINNPGEGTQAKRRSYCCLIDHLIPPMTSADKSDNLAKLDNLLEDYYRIIREDAKKIPIIQEDIIKQIKKEKLETDLNIDLEKDVKNFGEIVEKLHGYINEVSDTAINDGLHTLGEIAQGERFVQFIAQLTRLKNGDIPSLRDESISILGYDYLTLTQNRGKLIAPRFTRDNHAGNPERSERVDGKFTGARLIEKAHNIVLSILREAEECNWNETRLPAIVEKNTGKKSDKMLQTLEYISRILRPNLMKVTEEIDAHFNALSGRFVLPGGSGSITRGMTDILPTGRNFYSVDPYKIPSSQAWEVGKNLGDALVERYVKDHKKYPENIGMVIWGSPTMRTQGDDIAEVLYLMGLKPVWNKYSGRVDGLDVIPADRLKFPRIDVTLRTSGLLRDAFPNILELMDEAVQMAAALDESYDKNFLKRNIERETKEFKAKGFSAQESRRMASYRVFSGKPGCYGAGVNKMLDSKKWKDKKDLAEVYVDWGGYGYGKGSYGKEVKDVFRQRLKKMNLTVKNQDHRESDILSSDDYNAYHGGLNAAVTHFSGKKACSYSGDSSDPRKVKIRSTAEETKFIFRVRVLNPKWIAGMKRHGYKGAGDLSRLIDICFQWDATTDVIDDWMYEKLGETYAFDKEMQEWFKEHNPYALNNITERLLEAIERKMWNADEETKKKLQELYLKNEGDIEEILDETKETAGETRNE